MKHILKDECGYTLEKKCLRCGKETVLAKPSKFSLKDKYAEYRREVKKKELEEKGLY